MIANFLLELGLAIAVLITMMIAVLPIFVLANWIEGRLGESAAGAVLLFGAALLTAGVLVATGSGITG